MTNPQKIYVVIQEANGVPKTPDGIWFMNHGAYLNEDAAEDRMKEVMKKECITLGPEGPIDEDGHEAQWQFDVWEVEVVDA